MEDGEIMPDMRASSYSGTSLVFTSTCMENFPGKSLNRGVEIILNAVQKR